MQNPSMQFAYTYRTQMRGVIGNYCLKVDCNAVYGGSKPLL